MLKRDKQADVYSKKTIEDAFNKGTTTKEGLRAALAKAFQDGFNFAIDECRADNSNSGFDMAEYLEDLKDGTP